MVTIEEVQQVLNEWYDERYTNDVTMERSEVPGFEWTTTYRQSFRELEMLERVLEPYIVEARGGRDEPDGVFEDRSSVRQYHLWFTLRP